MKMTWTYFTKPRNLVQVYWCEFLCNNILAFHGSDNHDTLTCMTKPAQSTLSLTSLDLKANVNGNETFTCMRNEDVMLFCKLFGSSHGMLIKM